MENSISPPLSDEQLEEIEAEQASVTKTHWLQLTPLAVNIVDSLRFFDPAQPPVTKRPVRLKRILTTYALALFDAEAKHYPNSTRYEEWLLSLGDRVAKRVEAETEPLRLDHHLEKPARHLAIFETLRLRVNTMIEFRDAAATLATTINEQNASVASIDKGRSTQSKKRRNPKAERKSMWPKYTAQFSEKIFIHDMCWAANQRYREWTRWKKGELKDGCKADKAFRAILSSTKRPSEYRPEARPKEWK